MKGFRPLVALFAGVLTIGTASAQAQSAGDRQKAGQPQKGAPRKVLRLQELKVEGRVQKPQAMFLMPRANVGAGDAERSESFVPEVKRAVEKDPF